MIDLKNISPLAMYLSSFFAVPLPVAAALILAILFYWFCLVLPPVLAMQLFERKLGAHIQMRIGPNRVSQLGLLQPFADILKSLFKTNALPLTQERFLYFFGPFLTLLCVFLALLNVPFTSHWIVTNLDSGLVFIVIMMLASHLISFWSGYGIKSQWSVLSVFRMFYLVITYIVPLAFSILPVVLISGSINLVTIVEQQGGLPWQWLAFHNPGAMLSCIVLFLSLYIWQNRSPFNLAFVQHEIMQGVVAEYSGLQKTIFSFIEYATFYLSCAFFIVVYLGGGQTPFGLQSFGKAAPLIEWLYFLLKLFIIVFFSIWLRWSLPRVSINQLIYLSWRVLTPLGLLGTILCLLWLAMTRGMGISDFL